MEKTEEFKDKVKREGYKFHKIIIPFEKGVPKTCGKFEKDNRFVFVKGAGQERKYQIDREVEILKTMEKINLGKNIVFPRVLNSKHMKKEAFLVEEFLEGYEKTWGDEEHHYKKIVKIFTNYSRITKNPLPKTFDIKHTEQIEKIRKLPRKYSRALKIAGMNPRKFAKRYYNRLKKMEPLEEGIKFTLTHNDVNGNNFLYNERKNKYALVDFERTDFGAFFCDVGRSIVFSVLNWNLKRKKFELEIPQSKLFNSLRILLNEKEKRLLKFYLLLDNLKRINFYEDYMKNDPNYKNAIEFSKRYVKWAIKEILKE